jgi:dolichyl-phosphate-mannose-protein mannosyltransferase
MARPSKSAHQSPAGASKTQQPKSILKKTDDYTSEGVADHDVFLLPGTDYQVMIGVTILAAVIRLFRIYQPSSVVFDEVQYVISRSRLLLNC